MINLNSTDDVIEILVPDAAPSEYTTAAQLLQSEIRLRIDCPCEIIQRDSSSRKDDNTLQIQIETLETLFNETQSKIELPLKLLPYPDYAEHINIRTLQDDGIFKVLIVCGSEKSLFNGVGILLRFMQFGDNSLQLNPVNQNFKPLIPIRGCYFSKFTNSEPDNQNNIPSELITNHALWGNNTCGFNADCLTQHDINLIKKHQQSLLIGIDHKTGYSFPENPAISWFKSKPADIHSPKVYLDKFAGFTKSIANNPNLAELWLGIDGFQEDELDEIFYELCSTNNNNVKTIVYGPSSGPFEMIKREMPLTMQLISMNHLSEKNNSITTLARRFFDHAPLTYGALGYSTSSTDEIARFAWSMLSWSPQPTVDEILELYGGWFFGFPAAPIIKDALLTLEHDKKLAIELFNNAETLIPDRLKKLAFPRLMKIRSKF